MADLYNAADSTNILTAIGGAISAGDRVFISDSDSNYSGGSLAGAALALLLVTEDYSGNLGEGGVPIQVNVTSGTGVLDYGGTGQWAYFSAVTGIDRLIVRGHVRGNVKITTGPVSDWIAEGGNNIIIDGAVVTALTAVNCTVTAEDCATDITTLYVGSGATMLCDRGADLCTVGAGGVVEMTNRSRDFARVIVHGTLKYSGGNIGGGSASEVHPGGVLDLSGLRADLTISTAVTCYPGSKVVLPRSVTVTWTQTPIGSGAELVYV
jgi:hypothetical protein